jgi:hypothetical protein
MARPFGSGCVGAGPPGSGWAALLVVRLDNGAVFKSLHGFAAALPSTAQR